jgi:hypothetical protein
VAGDAGPLFAGAAESPLDPLDPLDSLAPLDAPALSVEVEDALGALDPDPLVSAGLFDVELYRSLYQPPPLRMNPPPREIIRRAVCSWHLGHSVSAASLMDCSNSHSFLQAEQAYSYVGIGETPRNPSFGPVQQVRRATGDKYGRGRHLSRRLPARPT